ncbi:hypothetical protein BH11BAC2_BH11BAC2_12390 [soil metagenome]
MKSSITDILQIYQMMGGMRETNLTGVYPNKLEITSSKYKHKWRIKVKNPDIDEDTFSSEYFENKSGTLKYKKTVVYNYKYEANGGHVQKFEIQEVIDEQPVSDLIEIKVDGLLVD